MTTDADPAADHVVNGANQAEEAHPGVRGAPLRGRRMVHADLKTDPGRELVLGLVEHAATSIEGMRPGVAERRGVGPAQCLARTIAQDLLGDVLASWRAQ